MKILYIIHQYFPDSIGGTEVLLEGLAKEMQQDGNEVAIFAYRESSSADPSAFGVREELVGGISLYRFHFNLSVHPNPLFGEFKNRFCDSALHDVVASFLPDVAHVLHGIKVGGGIFEVLEKAGVPMVTTLSDYWYFCLRHSLLLPDHSPCVSGPEPTSNCLNCLQDQLRLPDRDRDAGLKALQLRNPFLRDAVLRSNFLIALSEHQRDVYVRFGFPAQRIEVVHHGVNASLFAQVIEQRVSQPLVDAGRALRLLFVGTLLPHKGVHLLIDAILGMPEAAVELRVLGDANKGGQYADELLKKSADDDRITFVGECEHVQLPHHYQWCDILLMPSIWDENGTLVVKEARWCGIPVASHDLPGLRGLIEAEQDGWIIEQFTVEAWQHWLEQVKTWRKRYLPTGYDIATINSFAVAMMGYYQRALSANKD